MAEYTYNNSKHSRRKIYPFYINYGFEPRRNCCMDIQFKHTASEIHGQYKLDILKKVSVQLETSITVMKKYYKVSVI